MDFILRTSQWVNLIGLFLIADSLLILRGKRTPPRVLENLEGNELEVWRRTRFKGHMIMAAGFYSFTFSENLPLDVRIALAMNLTGLGMLLIGQLISIRNNIRKFGRWSSTF